ncbi:MAG: carboxymuconolactone decarboxylase family protein [Conexivisphaera sp.]
MSSTLDAVASVIESGKGELLEEDPGSDAFLEKVRLESGIVPERLYLTASFSGSLLREHLREKGELLRPRALERKYVFAIALAVSISIHDMGCQKVYLDQFIRNGGTRAELEDVMSVTRFITGNRAFVNALDVLRLMNSS